MPNLGHRHRLTIRLQIRSSSVNQRTDVELIQQTLNGESEAFGKLVQRYQDAVYATALHSIKDFAAAQDVAQETFIEAYRGIHTLREPGKFPDWLHTITLRQCGRWRRKRRDPTSIGDVEESQPGAVGPDEELERRELRRIVLNAIASLPEKAGEVVTMYYIDGLSYNEIANFLSVPASTVKGRLQMGRKQLKEELISMVEDSLKQNRPDKKFTEEVLAEIVERASEAWESDRHDEAMQFCDQALEALDHLDDTEEHKRTRMNVLRWQAHEWLLWYGNPQEAADNYQHAAQIAADAGDLESQAKWLLAQTIAISDTGNYAAMRGPIQSVREVYGALGDVQGQIACEAVMDLVDLLPEGWEQTWISLEEHTSYGSKRYSLTCSADSLTYIEDPPPGQRSRADVVLSARVHRGFSVFGFSSLLGRLGEPMRILALPPVVGDSWSGQVETRGGESLSLSRIVESDSDTIVVPAGRFENCLRVVTVGQEPADADFSDHIDTYLRRIMGGTRIMWFAPGVGLVKYCHYKDRGSVCSIQLAECQIEDAKQNDYFPLSIGNRWRYERYEEELGILLVTESYRVVAREGEEAHIACAMCSELLDAAAQRDYFNSCLEYEKASDGDPDARAWTLAGLGGAYARLGNMEAALEAYQRADEFASLSGNVKRQFDILNGTDWPCPPEFVLERYERGLQMAERMGDMERQKLCLGSMFDFALRHQRGKWYARALDAAQRYSRVVAELGDYGEIAFGEASIDLAQALMADPEGEKALNGGNRLGVSVEISDEGIKILTEDGVGHSSDRPYPPVCNDRFWLEDAPFLKFPVEVGEKWSHINGYESMVERTVESNSETVSVPAGKFDGAVRVKSTFQTRTANEGSPQANEAHNRRKEFRDGEKWMWFAPGAGIVKVEHHHANGKRTVIELVDYHIAEPSDTYFPLAIGNRWNYEWRNENEELLFKEQQRVALKHEGKFYLAVSGYTTNVAEYGEHKYG